MAHSPLTASDMSRVMGCPSSVPVPTLDQWHLCPIVCPECTGLTGLNFYAVPGDAVERPYSCASCGVGWLITRYQDEVSLVGPIPMVSVEPATPQKPG